MSRQLRALGQRIRATLRAIAGSNGTHDADFRAELEAHIEMQVEQHMGRGLSAEEARRQALLSGGGIAAALEAVHEQRGLPWVENTATDLRLAARRLRAKPGFTLAVTLTLGLGIGANAAMFTIVSAVVLRPLPYPAPDRIVSVSLSHKGKDAEVVADKDFFAWTADARSVTLAAYAPTSAVVDFSSGPEEVRGTLVSAPYFSIFGVRPLLGRTFSAHETRPGEAPVVILSEHLWRQHYAADSSVIGRSIGLDGKSATVVGVLPASFTAPAPSDYWQPYRLTPPDDDATFYYNVIGRVRGAASFEAVRAELAIITSRVDATRPQAERGQAPVVITLHDRRFGERERPLLLLFAAVGVLLLIACANLANLSLARATSRQREFAVRRALGATRARLLQYMLAESALLAVLGAALGLLLASWAVRYFATLSPAAVGNVDTVGVDGSVVAFATGLAIVTAVVFGLVPAALASRQDLPRTLMAGGRTGSNVRQQHVRRLLVVAQLATALVLLTAAGLVARTFQRVLAIDEGFRPDGVVAATFRLPRPRYSDNTAATFFEPLLAQVRRTPGVEAAALVDTPPLGGVRMSFSTKDSAGRALPRIDVVSVGSDYFRTIGAQLIEGRAIDETDRAGAASTVVVNESLARQLFPGSSAIGKTIPFRGGATIVGVVRNVLQRDIESPSQPVAYAPITHQGGSTYMRLVARTSAPATVLESAIASAARSIDPTLPPPSFTRMEDALATAVAPRKFTFVLLATFALIAATLAVVGLYGVLAHLVADRTREIGIRAALGANRWRVVRLIVRQGAVLVLAGTILGLVGASAMTRTITSLLYGVSPRDPLTFTVVPALLAAVALLATLIPASRAARVDPVIALRAE